MLYNAAAIIHMDVEESITWMAWNELTMYSIEMLTRQLFMTKTKLNKTAIYFQYIYMIHEVLPVQRSCTSFSPQLEVSLNG